jgi:hypothetical protein
MANLVGAAGVNIDRPLREECQDAADIRDHPIDLWKALQHPAIYQPGHCHRAVVGPAEDQGRHDVDAARLRRQRRGGMDVDRQFVARQPFVDREQLFTLQSLAVQISETAETAQAQLAHRTFQFIKRGFDIARRQRKKSDETFWVLPGDGGNRIVGDPGNLDRPIALEAIRTRRRNRQHMDIDPILIHML